MWQLWALTIAIPAAAALGLYAVMRTAGSGHFSQVEHRRAAILVFVLLLVATIWRNESERVDVDPYTDAQSPYEAF